MAHKETVNPFLSAAKDREFRESDDSDSDSDNEKEKVATNSKKPFKLSEQSTKFLDATPLKNAKCSSFPIRLTVTVLPA